MRILFILLFSFLLLPSFASEAEIKQNAFALYNLDHIDEAYNLLLTIPDETKDKEVYLILSNIELEKNNPKGAINYLNRAIVKDGSFYKAYYNLGLIYFSNNQYNLALDNFKSALKYADDNPYVLYNIGCCYIKLEEYKKAKRYLIRAIYNKKDEKKFYYNLAYVNKKIGSKKNAMKVIDFYNSTFNDN